MGSWQVQIDKATSATEVLSIARDYFALWGPEELGSLPAPCRPGRLREVAELEELNRCSVEALRRTLTTGDEWDLLQKLSAFVGRACMRLAQLRDDRGDDTAVKRNPSKSAAARGR